MRWKSCDIFNCTPNDLFEPYVEIQAAANRLSLTTTPDWLDCTDHPVSHTFTTLARNLSHRAQVTTNAPAPQPFTNKRKSARPGLQAGHDAATADNVDGFARGYAVEVGGGIGAQLADADADRLRDRTV